MLLLQLTLEDRVLRREPRPSADSAFYGQVRGPPIMKYYTVDVVVRMV